jgi:alkanesulfonate monooxygenase SsuD/methylene tetrahydromethanopterin reductase-like flavin-dependent oxidoreductase (luciferase family)
LSCAATQSPVQRYRDTVEQAVSAEELGFESVWPVEHHFHAQASISPCPTILLGAIAARTERLRLGTAIVQLSLCNPLRVAEEIATLDVLSGGRVELGVGRGSNPLHFAGFNVPMEQSRERTTEALRFLQRALRGERFSFEGRFFRAQDIELAPMPVGRVPMHMAANSVESAQQAGRAGLPILVAAHVQGFAKLGDLFAAYREARLVAGHAPATADDLSLVMPTFVAESKAQIERQLGASVQHMMGLLAQLSAVVLERCEVEEERVKLRGLLERMRSTDLWGVDASGGMFDTPSGCVGRLKKLREQHGIGRVIAWFNMGGLVSHAHVMRSMELFAGSVMPQLALSRAA